MAEISEDELNERVRVLRRFRSLLEMQRKKFCDYLEILEKQQDSINAENADIVASHAELETQVVEGICNLQKVIVPMAKLYYGGTAGGVKSGSVAAEDERVREIQSDLNRLQTQVLAQNKKKPRLAQVLSCSSAGTNRYVSKSLCGTAKRVCRSSSFRRTGGTRRIKASRTARLGMGTL